MFQANVPGAENPCSLTVVSVKRAQDPLSGKENAAGCNFPNQQRYQILKEQQHNVTELVVVQNPT
jgi:hypothetical protein